MSKVFNMVGGGGGKNVSSIIITGLSSTDTVTCTKGGKSYTVTWDETDQHWEIIGLPLGTITITATNGTKTITETVLIDIAGVYEIEMSFVLWLYKENKEYSDVTGGWSNTGYTAGTYTIYSGIKNDTNLYVYHEESPHRPHMFGTQNKIDLSPYTKIKATGKVTGVYNNAWGIKFSLLTSKNMQDPYKSNHLATLGDFTTEIDISNVDISCYVEIEAQWNAPSNGYFEKIWLE